MKISKRKDGRWRTQVKTPDGKYKSVYGKTKKECMQKASALIAEIENGDFVTRNTETLGGWCDIWFEDYTINLKENSKRIYSSYIRNQIKPILGNKKLQSLTNLDIQNFVNVISKNLSSRSVKDICNLLHKILDTARKAQLINHNPVEDMVLPKVKKKEMEVLSENEISLFLDAIYKTSEYADFFELILHTGLRVMEAIGLTESRYDREGKFIIIDRQQSRKPYAEFITTKTGTTRKIALTDRAEEIIEDRIYSTRLKREENPKYNPEGFIFCKKFGEHLNYTTLYSHLKKAVKIIGRPELKIHDLRHTYATLAIKAGVDIKTLQNTLGHTSAQMTLDVYSHSTDDMKKESAVKMGTLFDTLKK